MVRTSAVIRLALLIKVSVGNIGCGRMRRMRMVSDGRKSSMGNKDAEDSKIQRHKEKSSQKYRRAVQRTSVNRLMDLVFR